MTERAGGTTVRASEATRILQVSTRDIGGGAEKVAWDLFRSYRQRGYASWLAVGQKRSEDPDVLPIPDVGPKRVLAALAQLPFSGNEPRPTRRAAAVMTLLGRSLDARCGVEAFRYPGTWELLKLSPRSPSVVHCHNLHSHYFDLRALPWLSAEVPVILTLHDAWLLTGHCSHPIDCGRWKTGCGHCPDLSIYPAIQRDATRFNWRRKRKLYARSQLRIATPSQWLMTQVEQSMLGASNLECRIIPNGVDRAVFSPASKTAARQALGIKPGTKVLLFAANGIRSNPWKDFATMRAAVAEVGSRLHDQELLWLAVGENAPSEQIGRAELRFVPYQKAPQDLARHYHAADAYIHGALIDTFPNTVLEALACGTTVIATAVGGIPEQVKTLRGTGCSDALATSYDADQATGILVPPRDAAALAAAILRVLGDDELRRRLERNAAGDAVERFDLARQVDSYLAWYAELVTSTNERVQPVSVAS